MAWQAYTGGALFRSALLPTLAVSVLSIIFGVASLFRQPVFVLVLGGLFMARLRVEGWDGEGASDIVKHAWLSGFAHAAMWLIAVGEAMRLLLLAPAPAAGDERSLVEYSISVLLFVACLLPTLTRSFGLQWWASGVSALPLLALVGLAGLRVDEAVAQGPPSPWSMQEGSLGSMLWRLSGLTCALVLSALYLSESATRMCYDRLGAAGACCDSLHETRERKEMEIRMLMKTGATTTVVPPGGCTSQQLGLVDLAHVPHFLRVHSDDDDPREGDEISYSLDNDARSHHTSKVGHDVQFVKVQYLPA